MFGTLRNIVEFVKWCLHRDPSSDPEMRTLEETANDDAVLKEMHD